MSSLSYSKLGSSCHLQRHCALTNNNKYILPDDNNYYRRFTPMMYYPGYENGIIGNIFDDISEPENIKIGEPENIKAYNKQYIEKQTGKFNIKESCQGCKNPN